MWILYLILTITYKVDSMIISNLSIHTPSGMHLLQIINGHLLFRGPYSLGEYRPTEKLTCGRKAYLNSRELGFSSIHTFAEQLLI